MLFACMKGYQKYADTHTYTQSSIKIISPLGIQLMPLAAANIYIDIYLHTYSYLYSIISTTFTHNLAYR